MPSGIYTRTDYHGQRIRDGISATQRKTSRGLGKRQLVGQRKSMGYIWLYVPVHPLADNNGWVKRCIIVMEGILGRFLTLEEIVDHKNRITDDDSPENLQLFANLAEHTAYHSRNGSLGNHRPPGYTWELINGKRVWRKPNGKLCQGG